MNANAPSNAFVHPVTEMILGLSALRNDRSREQEATSATKDAITLDNLNVKAKKYYDQVIEGLREDKQPMAVENHVVDSDDEIKKIRCEVNKKLTLLKKRIED